MTRKEDVVGWATLVAVVAVAVAMVWLFVSALNYNAWSAGTCENAGLTWVKEYPFGDYGCAKVVPFDVLEAVKPS